MCNFDCFAFIMSSFDCLPAPCALSTASPSSCAYLSLGCTSIPLVSLHIPLLYRFFVPPPYCYHLNCLFFSSILDLSSISLSLPLYSLPFSLPSFYSPLPRTSRRLLNPPTQPAHPQSIIRSMAFIEEIDEDKSKECILDILENPPADNDDQGNESQVMVRLGISRT